MTKDWVHGVGHSPVCQILLQIVVTAAITSSPPAWTSSAGVLSTSAMIFIACIFNLFSMVSKHDFAWLADKANRSVVLALLQFAFLGKCDD